MMNGWVGGSVGGCAFLGTPSRLPCHEHPSVSCGDIFNNADKPVCKPISVRRVGWQFQGLTYLDQDVLKAEEEAAMMKSAVKPLAALPLSLEDGNPDDRDDPDPGTISAGRLALSDRKRKQSGDEQPALATNNDHDNDDDDDDDNDSLPSGEGNTQDDNSKQIVPYGFC